MYLAALGLCLCAGFSLVAGSGGCSLAAVCVRFIAVASLTAEPGLWDMRASVLAPRGLSSYGSLAWLPETCGICPDRTHVSRTAWIPYH